MDKPAPIRISISEAATFFGVSQKTIRRAVTLHQIEYILVLGRYKLSFDSVLAWSQKTAYTRTKRDQNGLGRYVDRWQIPSLEQAEPPSTTPPSP